MQPSTHHPSKRVGVHSTQNISLLQNQSKSIVNNSRSFSLADEESKKASRDRELPITWHETLVLSFELVTENVLYLPRNDQQGTKSCSEIFEDSSLQLISTDTAQSTTIVSSIQSWSDKGKFLERGIGELSKDEIIALPDPKNSLDSDCDSLRTITDQVAEKLIDNSVIDGKVIEDENLTLKINSDSFAIERNEYEQQKTKNETEEVIVDYKANEYGGNGDTDCTTNMLESIAREIQHEFREDESNVESRADVLTDLDRKQDAEIVNEIVSHAKAFERNSAVFKDFDEIRQDHISFTELEAVELMNFIGASSATVFQSNKKNEFTTSEEASNHEIASIILELINGIEADRSEDMENVNNGGEQSTNAVCEVELLKTISSEAAVITRVAESAKALQIEVDQAEIITKYDGVELHSHDIDMCDMKCAVERTTTELEDKLVYGDSEANVFDEAGKLSSKVSTTCQETERNSHDCMNNHLSSARSDDDMESADQALHQELLAQEEAVSIVETSLNYSFDAREDTLKLIIENEINRNNVVSDPGNRNNIASDPDILVQGGESSRMYDNESSSNMDTSSRDKNDNLHCGAHPHSSFKFVHQSNQEPTHRSPKIFSKLYSDQMLDDAVSEERMSTTGRSHNETRRQGLNHPTGSDHTRQSFGKPPKEHFKRQKNFNDNRQSQKYYTERMQTGDGSSSTAHYPSTYGMPHDWKMQHNAYIEQNPHMVYNPDIPGYEERRPRSKRRGKRSGKSHKPNYMPS